MTMTNAQRQARHRERNRDVYRKRDAARKRQEHRTRPFVMWDGEGCRDTGYSLFGSSEGDVICHPDLSTRECLELLLECEARVPDAIHFGFAFDYDVNMILKDLSWRHLNLLRRRGKTVWNGYTITHIPGKWFTVKSEGLYVKVFDVFSFFGVSYHKTLEQYEIGTKRQRDFILAGKKRRDLFMWESITAIMDYWHTELLLGPVLMDGIRMVLDDAGYPIHSWHGPGALARYELNRRKIRNCMKESPSDVWIASRYAYTGGRFELFQAGVWDGPVYNYDINSAYPYAITKLPDLARGQWERVRDVSRTEVSGDKFAVYHIRYHMAKNGDPTAPQPLFRRMADDSVRWAWHTEGWYWSPEAELVKDDPQAEFVEGWVFHEHAGKPFRWVQESYDKRLWLKSIGSPLQLGIKLMLNSMYGQFAQRVGWEYEGKAPRSHQLEWAGYITSVCKAMVHRAALYSYRNGGLISIDTDGIYTTCEIPDDILTNGIGPGLGQWESNEYSGILCWQSGVYWLRDTEGQWTKPKTRGAPTGTVPFWYAAIAAVNLNPIKYVRHTFTGYRTAMQGRFDRWRVWEDEPVALVFAGSDGGKRYHPKMTGVMHRACPACMGDKKAMHKTFPHPAMTRDCWSKMHSLPWLENDHDRPEELDHNLIDMIWDEGTL